MTGGNDLVGEPPGKQLEELEIERYSRQLLLPQVGEAGQLRLASATVVVVGCGGLGVPAALYLAGAGVGRLRLIDADEIALDNLSRQIAYHTSEVGQTKVKVLAERIAALNPGTEVDPVDIALEPAGADQLLADAQLVLECSDSPETKFLVNDRCVGGGIPLVLGGAVRFAGQLLAVPVGAPCYRCLFGASPEGAARLCRDAGVLGPVVGAIGAHQALEGLKLLLGLAQPGGRLLDFDGLTSRWRELRFPRDPGCPAHTSLEVPSGHN